MPLPDRMRTGGCQCGYLRYEITADPVDLYACHCRECRKQSGSAHGISVIVPRDAIRMTGGEPKIWSRPTDSGNTIECLFCPNCGSRIVHRDADADGTFSVKGGSLDDPPDMTGAKHIWTDRAVAGIVIPADSEKWPREPED